MRTAARHARRRLAAGLLWGAALTCAALPGCVHRRMTIRSDPPGALVLLEGEEIGYTPVSLDFTYYGTREITLVKNGYETLKIMQAVRPPWYQRVPLDFFSDNLLPFKANDRHDFSYRMERQMIVSDDELLQRANGLRSDAQISP